MTPPDFRALCAELVTELEGWCGTGSYDNTANAHSVINRARAALAQPGAEVGQAMQLPEQAPDEHPPSNLDRREIVAWYHGHGCGWQAARAVLAHWGRPAPPAEGEVGK